jgi:hypothetical protein
MVTTRSRAIPTAAVEKTTWTASDDSATPSSARVDSKRRQKVPRTSLIGLLLIMSSSEAEAMKEIINSD